MQRWMRLAGTAGAAVLMVCVVTSAFAQEGGQGRGRGGRGGFGFGGGMFGGGQNVVSLAGNEAVQKDLALTEDQIAKVKTLNEDYGDARREAMQGLGFGPPGQGEQPSPEEMQKRMAAMQEANKKVLDEFKPKLVEIVSADQLKRLEEIALQARGTQALSDAETAAKLGLTDEQKTKVADTAKEFGEKQRELFSAGFGGDGGGDIREKIQTLNKERDDALLAVLTQEQKDKLAELKGKEFDVSQLRGRGRGGFGGPGGPGGARGDRPQRPAADGDTKSGT